MSKPALETRRIIDSTDEITSVRVWKSCLALMLSAPIALGLLSACERAQSPAPVIREVGTGPSEAAAWVGAFPIPVQAVQLEAVAQGLADPDMPLPVDSVLFANILDQLIDQHLLAQEAQRLALDTHLDIRHKIAMAHERILSNSLLTRLMAKNVDEAALRKMYEAQRELVDTGEEIHVRHILLDSRADAARIIKKLDGGESFSQLADQVSLDSYTAPHGGDMGYIQIEDVPIGLRQTLQELTPGQIGGPVQTILGWHVLMMEDRRIRAAPDFEDLRPQITRFLTLRTLDRELNRLRGLSRITRLSFDHEKNNTNKMQDALLDATTASLAALNTQTGFSAPSVNPRIVSARVPVQQGLPNSPSIHPAKR